MVALENRNTKILTEAQEDAITYEFMDIEKSRKSSLAKQYGISEATIGRAIERSWTRQGERTKKRFEDEA